MSGRNIISISFSGKLQKRVSGNDIVRFQPGINILCGPNGSGKSTVLEALSDSAKKTDRGKDAKEMSVKADACRVHYRDFEKHNPRVSTGYFDGSMASLAAVFSSHGEFTAAVVFQGITAREFRGSTMLLDEPEQALDAQAMIKLRKLLASDEVTAGQVILATHSPFLLCRPPGVWTVVELVPGYRESVEREMIELLAGPSK